MHYRGFPDGNSKVGRFSFSFGGMKKRREELSIDTGSFTERDYADFS
jgi:hypothetical protein